MNEDITGYTFNYHCNGSFSKRDIQISNMQVPCKEGMVGKTKWEKGDVITMIYSTPKQTVIFKKNNEEVANFNFNFGEKGHVKMYPCVQFGGYKGQAFLTLLE